MCYLEKISFVSESKVCSMTVKSVALSPQCLSSTLTVWYGSRFRGGSMQTDATPDGPIIRSSHCTGVSNKIRDAAYLQKTTY